MSEKVKITDFGLLSEYDPITITIGDAEVQVKTKIPYEEVFEAIQWSVTIIMDDRPFVSAALRDVIFNFSLIKFYTNIDVDFLDMSGFSLVDLYSNYDILDQYNVFAAVREKIDEQQLQFYTATIKETLDSIVAYRNSAQGIIDAVAINAKENTQTIDSALSILHDEEKVGEVERLMDMVSRLGTTPNGENVIPLNKE